jgi:pyruvate formate lyase activating enzyme
VEVTTLIIPGLNDGKQVLESLASFLAEALGPETPWHISRFHPTYKLMDRPVTPVGTLRQAREIGLGAGLRHVYTGNVPGEASESTFCHNCGRLLIERRGFSVQSYGVIDGTCPDCGSVLDGIGV